MSMRSTPAPSPAPDPDAAGPAEVDPRFRAARARAAARRRRGLAVRGVAALVIMGLLGAAGWWAWPRPDGPAAPPRAAEAPSAPAEDPAAPSADDLAMLDAFLDIPGDPMRLTIGAGGRSAARTLPRPEGLPEERGRGDVVVLRDVMVSTGDRLVTALPSSREDFAIFQAQRRGLSVGAPPPPDAEAEVLVSFRPAEPVAGAAVSQTHPRTATEAAAWLTTRGQRHGQSRLGLRPTAARAPLIEDTVLRLTTARPLADILVEAGLGRAEAAAVAADAAAAGLPDPAPGQIVALRLLVRPTPGDGGRLAQIALYSGTEYVGALAREPGAESEAPQAGGPTGDAGDDDEDTAPAAPSLVAAADPWLGANLQRLAARSAADTAAGPAQFRVLDAFYSAAMRNRLPAGLVGEVIMLLSEAHDLDAFASPGDRMTLVHSAEPPADPDAPQLAQVLYVAIEGAEVDIRCYLYRPAPNQPHSCYGASRGRGVGATPAVAAAPADSADGGAVVEALVDRIIIIESAGRADARNPLSTATGLGQFIESTWVRMMRTYRPDLYTTLPRDQLLALRTDPVISREMVTALAREGEAYLRARGHQITPGRLYLAHFLGMEGAHLVLTQPPEAGLLEVLGAAVIRANPFLDGRDVAYIVDWAEGRMRGGGRAVVVRDPPGLIALRALVDAVLTEG